MIFGSISDLPFVAIFDCAKKQREIVRRVDEIELASEHSSQASTTARLPTHVDLVHLRLSYRILDRAR